MKKTLSIFLLLIIMLCTACGKGAVTDPTTGTTAVTTATKTTSSTEETTTVPKVEGLFPHSVVTDREPYSAVDIANDPKDPYSAVIKEYYQYVLDSSSDAKDMLDSAKYALYDIDGDGTNELLLSMPQYLYKENKRTMFLEHIFAVKDGVAYEVQPPKDNYSDWKYLGGLGVDNREILSNGLIRITRDQNVCCFKYENGELTFVKELVVEDGKFKHVYPAQDGAQEMKEVSKKEFNALKTEVEDGAKAVNIDWKPLESYGK
ncbi:MAG: hypothetical protein K5756_09365 [Clostridiales bacterium]|nr:hypothetical protein [Clostridiales bacterium]